MSRNTLSIIISIFLTAIFALSGARLFGPLDVGSILASAFFFLPFLTILFAIIYLSMNKFLPQEQNQVCSKKNREKIKEPINPDIVSYRLQKEYIFLGIPLLAICLYGAFFIRDGLSYIFLILVITHLATNPYRVDLLKDDTLIIYRVFRKKKINISEITRVVKGIYYDKIEFRDEYVYFNHLISNITKLTDILLQKLNEAPMLNHHHTAESERNNRELYFRAALVILVAVLFSVFVVFYFKEFAKKI